MIQPIISHVFLYTTKNKNDDLDYLIAVLLLFNSLVKPHVIYLFYLLFSPIEWQYLYVAIRCQSVNNIKSRT